MNKIYLYIVALLSLSVFTSCIISSKSETDCPVCKGVGTSDGKTLCQICKGDGKLSDSEIETILQQIKNEDKEDEIIEDYPYNPDPKYRPTQDTDMDEDVNEDDTIIKCPYCNGTGESYIGLVTPLMERDLLNPSIYLCEVCGGEKRISKSEAEKRIKALQKIRGF